MGEFIFIFSFRKIRTFVKSYITIIHDLGKKNNNLLGFAYEMF